MVNEDVSKPCLVEAIRLPAVKVDFGEDFTILIVVNGSWLS
jgi:hypothetical protein